MATYKIALLPGDGTGPEVLREGVKVLKAASDRYGFSFETQEYDFGGDRYLKTKEVLPDSAIDELRQLRRHLPGRHRPSRRQARHPGEGHLLLGCASSWTSTSTSGR
jgi:isocitrate/isopropylmalate dehydrogenase